MAKIKLAIIGATGTANKRTLPALVNSSICEVVAIQGRNSEKLKKIQNDFNIKEVYTDIDEMLENAVYDCLYIGTPPFLHYDDVEKASKTKKPIICEKPLAINYEEGVKVAKLLKNYSDETFMIAHHLRHQKALSDIKNIIESGKIGKILNVSMQWGFEMNLEAPSAIWKTNPNLGGEGTFSDNGIHIVDLAIYLFGTPITVFGKVETVRTKQTFDNETAILYYNEFIVELQSSQCMKYAGNHILIYGTKGSIEAFNAISEKYIKKIEIKSDNQSEIIEYEPTNLYGNEVENFCFKLTNQINKNVGTTLEEGLNSLKIIDLVRKSAKDNLNYNFENE